MLEVLNSNMPVTAVRGMAMSSSASVKPFMPVGGGLSREDVFKQQLPGGRPTVFHKPEFKALALHAP